MENRSTFSSPLYNNFLGLNQSNFLFPVKNQSNFLSHTFFLPRATISFTDIVNNCSLEFGTEILFGLKLLILFTALPCNGALLWLLFKNRSNMSPSQVLAFNIAIMDILFCFWLPFDIYGLLHGHLGIVYPFREGLSALYIFGCPLLLMFMCLERYIAAAFPLTYLHFRKRKYRIVLCVLAWVLTVFVGLLLLVSREFTIFLALVVTMVSFLVMLLCLVGIVWVLCQSGPGDGATSNNSLKKGALKNILMVIVPSVIAYSPLVAALSYFGVSISERTFMFGLKRCRVLQILLTFPIFGIYIGPLFYSSQIRQMVCCKKGDSQGEDGKDGEDGV